MVGGILVGDLSGADTVLPAILSAKDGLLSAIFLEGAWGLEAGFVIELMGFSGDFWRFYYEILIFEVHILNDFHISVSKFWCELSWNFWSCKD